MNFKLSLWKKSLERWHWLEVTLYFCFLFITATVLAF